MIIKQKINYKTVTKNKNNIQKDAIEPKKEEIKNINKQNKKLDTSKCIEGESNRIEIVKTKTKGKKIICEYYNFCYKSNNIITKFNFKNASKNNKFYYCYKRGMGCGGFAIYDIIKEEFRVYKECNFEIDHEYKF